MTLPFGVTPGVMYDALYPLSEHYVDFVASLCNHRPRVLELGCGTGRLTLPLAEMGHQMIGVDCDPAMLQRAREKARERKLPSAVEWIEADFTRPYGVSHVDAAFFSSNTLMLIGQIERRFAAINTAASSLASDGVLIIILNNTAAQVAAGFSRQQSRTAFFTPDVKLTTSEERVFDPAEFTWVGRDVLTFERGTDREVIERPVVHGAVFGSEIELAANLAGLTVTNTYGDYRYGPLSQTSPKAIYVLARSS